MPILAVVLHPFLSVVLYHLPAVKNQPNNIHNQSFTTTFEQKNIAVLFRLPHWGKIEHLQSFTKSIYLYHLPSRPSVKTHYPLAAMLYENCGAFRPSAEMVRPHAPSRVSKTIWLAQELTKWFL
jgi:hypothetical protein